MMSLIHQCETHCIQKPLHAARALKGFIKDMLREISPALYRSANFSPEAGSGLHWPLLIFLG
jgi:hypothetical protein